MDVSARLLTLAVMVLSSILGALVGLADNGVLTTPAEYLREVVLLSVTATVRMPDGSPVAGAIVESIDHTPDPSNVVRANDSGEVQIRGIFGGGARIHASSPDGAYQTTRMVMAADVRSTFSTPIQLTLAPAIRHSVRVTSSDLPVEGAHVVAIGHGFRVRGVTGPDGKAELRLPASEPLQELVAWHAELGVGGIRDLEKAERQESSHLSLLAPAPHTIRVVDRDGNSVEGLALGISVRTEDSDWIVAREIKAAHVRSNEKGELTVSWMPRELQYVDVDIIDSPWKVDEIDRERISEGIVTVHVRRKRPIQGRLILPDGASAEGILITGFAFGPAGRGDIPRGRARQDGTFTIDVTSSHAYILGVSDLQWAGEIWSGMILPDDLAEPAKLEINVSEAIPLTVRATRGNGHEPVPNAWVDLSQRGSVQWTDETGKERTGSAGVGGWLRTGADGIARAGVRRGEIEVRLQVGEWMEERTIKIASDEPVDVEFHRAWLGKRRITARPRLDGAPYRSSPTMVALAWTEREGYSDIIHEPKIRSEGTIEIEFDEENVALLLTDRESGYSGFARFGTGDRSKEIVMQPNAAYSGTILDDEGKPLSDRTVRLITESSFLDVVEPQQTDEAGRFRFTSVVVGAPLRVDIKNADGLPEYFLAKSRLFEPGELRQDDVLKCRRLDSENKIATPTPALSERLASAIANARVGRMRTVVVLQGDDSQSTVALTGRLMDYNESEAILRYLPVIASMKDIESESAKLANYKWPLPNGGEILLVVLDGDMKAIATERIGTGNQRTAVEMGATFLTDHMPAGRDALELLAEARREAESSGRRVWIVHGGPRCGPCFRLARWMDEHHSTLERDYVIVKAIGGIDEHVAEVFDPLPRKGQGIPWFAIIEPDSTVLATSDGPLGNIGMPSSVEGIRHFRSMLEASARKLSSADIDELIASLLQGQ